MRYAIFSDVHANLEALDAVLKGIREAKPDCVLFVGDAVGYGPDPNACMERIFEAADKIVAGNHDLAVVGQADIAPLNPFAREAILWTRSVLTEDSRDRILAMPLTAKDEDIYLVHASPDRPEAWSYIFSAFDAARQFDFFDEQICVIGHSHRPAVYGTDGESVWEASDSMLTLDGNCRYIVNAGSVGQPRDRNPDAGYVLYDTDEKRLSIERIPYDLRSTQEKMRAAHLPSFLIDRLTLGA